ncbi:putative tail fiber protein [Ralstonia phage 10RS305A]|nr:putative tail fiber protein [Ralstonia phage 10RS305A]
MLTIEATANAAKAEAQAATAATTGLMDNDLKLFVNGTQRRDIKVHAGKHDAPGVQRAGVRFTDVDAVAVERFDQSTGAYIDTPVRVDQATGDVILTKKLRGLATPTLADEASTKAYSDLRVLKGGDLMTGPLAFDPPTNTSHPGAVRINYNFGHQGAHVDWTASRKYPVQIDVTDNTAAYSGIRWTHWGVRHVAAIDCYGNNGGAPNIQFSIGSITRAWIFGESDIYRGQGGNVWGTWNLNPCRADWVNDVGIEGNDVRRPYMRRASDGYLVRIPKNFSGNTVEIGWDGGCRWYIDGQDMGRSITTLQHWGHFHSDSGRVGRDGDWVVGSGYFDVVIDGTSYGVPFNPSDARRKENIVASTEDALAKVKLIKFYSFNFKEGSLMDSKKVHQTGFIAQQLQGIDPALVIGDDNPDMTLSPDVNGLLSLALKSIQQLSEQVESLKAEVLALKGNP